MHEASIARQILQAALARANADGASRVTAVRGWVADTETLSRESIALQFAAHAQGSQAEGALLDLTLTHVEARCLGCQRSYAPEHHLLLCPHCNGTEADVLGPTGLGLTSIDVV